MTRPLRVLVACEFSGAVREEFLLRGHDAWSCDLLPDERGSNRHIVCDVREILNDGWDLLMVAHPPHAPLQQRRALADRSAQRKNRRVNHA